jgi:hypothetical protein
MASAAAGSVTRVTIMVLQLFDLLTVEATEESSVFR